MKSCEICTEKFSKRIKKEIKCFKCRKVACHACYDIFIDSVKDISCMFCKQVWSLEFMYTVFTKKYIDTKIKNHYKNKFFQNELSLVPFSMPLVELEERKSAIYEKIEKLVKTRELVDKEINKAHRELNQLRETHFATTIHCPGNNCTGILNENYECIVCNFTFCKDCHVELKGNHKCNSSDIETVNEIKNNSINCPSCSTLVYKIEGCDEMYCTICKTPFNWKTGHIITRHNVHNPHVEMGSIREIGDEPCQGIPDNNMLFAHEKYDTFTLRCLRNFISFVRRTSRETMETYNIDYITTDLRVKYIRKLLNEDEYKHEMFIRFKKQQKNMIIREILDILVACTIDQCNNILEGQTYELTYINIINLVFIINDMFKKRLHKFIQYTPCIATSANSSNPPFAVFYKLSN